MPRFNETVQAFSATLEPTGTTRDISYLMADVAASGGTHPRLYVSHPYLVFAGLVSIFDALTLEWLSDVTVGQPVDMTVAPAGDRLYVSCLVASTLWTLDLTTDPVSVLSYIPVGKNPKGIGVSPDGTRVVVACGGDDTVWVFDAQTTPMTLIGAPVKVGNSPYAVAVAGHQAFVTNKGSGNISVIDITATPPVTVGTPIPVAGQPREIAVTKDGLWLLVAYDEDGLAAMVWQKFHYQAADTSAGQTSPDDCADKPAAQS